MTDRGTLVRLLRWAFALAVAAAIGLVVARNLDQLDEVDIRLSGGWLAAAIVTQLAATALLPLGWRALVRAFGAGEGLDRTQARRVWWFSQAARYLPTGVAGFATRFVLARDVGIAATVTGATLAMELVHLVALLAIVGAIAGEVLPDLARVGIGLGGVAVLAAVDLGSPLGLRLLQRLLGRDLHRPRRGALGRATSIFGVSVGLRAVRAPLLAAAVVPLGAGDALAVAGADALGAAAGIVGITPAGIGTREAVITGLLQARLGLGTALTVAVALRALDLLVELLWIGRATVDQAAWRRRHAPLPEEPR